MNISVLSGLRFLGSGLRCFDVDSRFSFLSTGLGVANSAGNDIFPERYQRNFRGACTESHQPKNQCVRNDKRR